MVVATESAMLARLLQGLWSSRTILCLEGIPYTVGRYDRIDRDRDVELDQDLVLILKTWLLTFSIHDGEAQY
jgi:hypothetical protein